MTGAGRVGAFLASEAFGLLPDAVTLAKGLGGGLRAHRRDSLEPRTRRRAIPVRGRAATLAWTPLACAAALANLRLIRSENLAANARAMGAKLLAALRELSSACSPRTPAKFADGLAHRHRAGEGPRDEGTGAEPRQADHPPRAPGRANGRHLVGLDDALSSCPR